MNKIKEFWFKIKKIRHYEIYLALIIGVILCVFYFSFFSKTEKDKINNDTTEKYSSTVEYIDTLENKLCNVLSKISSVGKVDVIITLESGFSYEYAKNTETKTTTSGNNKTSVTTETLILVSNKPVVSKEIYPKIKGVVVVAEGAEDFNLKMKILSAVETVLEVERNNITILA